MFRRDTGGRLLTTDKVAAVFAFKKVAGELLPNLFFYGIGVVAIILVSRRFGWVGLAGFWVYAAILALSLVQLLISLVTGVAVLFAPKARLTAAAKATLLSAALIRGVEDVVFAGYTWVLYRYSSLGS
jgi:hypothetical protein